MAQSADVADTHAEAAASLGKNSNYAYGEADFWAGYLSERLDWFREVYRWYPQFIGQKRTWTQKNPRSNGAKSDPHRKRPTW